MRQARQWSQSAWSLLQVNAELLVAFQHISFLKGLLKKKKKKKTNKGIHGVPRKGPRKHSKVITG